MFSYVCSAGRNAAAARAIVTPSTSSRSYGSIYLTSTGRLRVSPPMPKYHQNQRLFALELLPLRRMQCVVVMPFCPSYRAPNPTVLSAACILQTPTPYIQTMSPEHLPSLSSVARRASHIAIAFTLASRSECYGDSPRQKAHCCE